MRARASRRRRQSRQELLSFPFFLFSFFFFGGGGGGYATTGHDLSCSRWIGTTLGSIFPFPTGGSNGRAINTTTPCLTVYILYYVANYCTVVTPCLKNLHDGHELAGANKLGQSHGTFFLFGACRPKTKGSKRPVSVRALRWDGTIVR